jgi:hypothetical protein
MGQVSMPITSKGRAPEQLTAAATLRCEAMYSAMPGPLANPMQTKPSGRDATPSSAGRMSSG